MKITIPEEYQSFYEVTKEDFIRKYPDPILYETAQTVKEFSDEIKALSEKMKDYVENTESCIGLAANQVGSLERLFVLENEDEIITVINPEILEASEYEACTASCASFPFLVATNQYPSLVKLKFYDVEGTEHIKQFEGFPAFCVQHETDHLNGVLFIDKADPDSIHWETLEGRQERIEKRKKDKK